MKKIKKLTPEQELDMQATLEKWLAVGRSTERIDREKATNIICKFYAAINKPSPKVWFFSSPMTCILAYGLLSRLENQASPGTIKNNLRSNLGSNLRLNLGSNLASNLESNLWSNLESNLRSNLESNLWSNLESNLRSNLGSNLRLNLGSNLASNLESNLWSNLESNLRSNLESNLWSNLESNLRSNLGRQLENYFGGNHWCAWQVYYKFCYDIGVKYSETDINKLDMWIEEAAQCHWWFPYENIVLVSDRPTVLKIDNLGRLHNEKGPAMAYSDGYSLYVLHGVIVPEKYILEPVAAKDLLKESNAQIRMAVIRKEGYGKFIKDLKGKLISETPSTRGSSKPVQLWELQLPEIGATRLLKLTWWDTKVEQETFLVVPNTQQEFKEMFGVVPTDVNNAELVRLATMRIDTSKYEIVYES